MNALTIDVVLREAVSETGFIILTLRVGEGDHLCWSRAALLSPGHEYRKHSLSTSGETLHEKKIMHFVLI